MSPICKKKFWEKFDKMGIMYYISDMKKTLVIQYEVKDDGKLYLDFGNNSKDKINYSEVLSVLVSSVSMAIRIVGERSSPETEGKVFNDVINHLQKEFVNPNSFDDLEVIR